MPVKAPTIPSYCHHKAKGLAFVKLGSDFVYLGAYGSPESKVKYERTVAEWLARGRYTPPAADEQGPSVNEILLAYWRFAENFYANPDGTPGLELDKLALAIGPLKALYGETQAQLFGPVALKAVRQKMIESKLSRTTINQRISCIKRIFKWAVSEELVPASSHHGLQAVTGLRRGRCAAKETEPVRPVPDAHVDVVLPFLCPTLQAMVQLQRYTGMRSGELCLLRHCDLEKTGEVWIYRPPRHKTQHHGHERIVRIGRRGRAVVEPLLTPDLNAYVFSPRRARDERNAIKRAGRKSKVQPSQRDRRKRTPRRGPGQRYDTKSYYHGVIYGMDRAVDQGVLAPECRWHPHQLRHNFATAVRKEFGLDAARAVLGQRSLAIADTYAEIDHALAGRVAANIG